MVLLPPMRRPFIRREPQQPSDDNPEEKPLDDGFSPLIDDVLKVRHIFLWKVKPEGLPAEVVDMIVDAAEYWPSTKVTLEKGRRINKDVDEAMLCTSPLCYDEKVSLSLQQPLLDKALTRYRLWIRPRKYSLTEPPILVARWYSRFCLMTKVVILSVAGLVSNVQQSTRDLLPGLTQKFSTTHRSNHSGNLYMRK